MKQENEITGVARFRNGWVVYTAAYHIIKDNCTLEEAIEELRQEIANHTNQD